MNLKEKIAALISEGKTKDEAVAIAYEMLKKKEITKDSTTALAVVAAEGNYVYEDGSKFKEYEELKKAYTGDLFLPVHATHESTDVVGVAYDFHADDVSRSIVGKIHGAKLHAGAGVSGGFSTIEVPCAHGICQRQMTPEHVAASDTLVPRGAKNTVMIGDQKSEIFEMSEDIKKALDSANATVEQLKKENDAFKEKERKTLVDSFNGVFNDTLKLDSMCLHDLTVLRKGEDARKPKPVSFSIDSELDSAFKSVIKTKGDGE